jgi:hypothetical protein
MTASPPLSARPQWPRENHPNPSSLWPTRLQILAEFRQEFSNSVPIWWFCPRNYGICNSTYRIFPVFFHYVTIANQPFCTTPQCKACLGPSERAYLSLFGLRDSQRSCFEEVNHEQLQVELPFEEKTPKVTGTWKNFRQNYDSEPSSRS